jgi:hypothetical protein
MCVCVCVCVCVCILNLLSMHIFTLVVFEYIFQVLLKQNMYVYILSKFMIYLSITWVHNGYAQVLLKHVCVCVSCVCVCVCVCVFIFFQNS